MRVVVTGALGHVGSRLIRELAIAFPGIEIVMLDNLASERYASLFDLPDSGHFEFVEADVLTADLARIFEGADAVIHLAALTNWARVDLRARMQRVNVEGTERVAQACIAAGAAMLFPSTTSVYGVPQGVVDEGCPRSALQPHTGYAEWKLQSENMLQTLSHQRNLRMVIFRMGTIFGPSAGMRFHTAVNRFCWQAMAGQPIEVWRTASSQVRPYLDLSDAVRAMTLVLRRRQFDGRVYNVLTLNATVADVVNVLSTFVPRLKVTYVESPHMNSWSYSADNSRFMQLGFEFSGSLTRGIGGTVGMLAQRPMDKVSLG